MAETNIAVTPGSGANVDVEQLAGGNLRQVVCIGDPSNAAGVANVDPVKGIDVFSISQQSDQCISITGVTGAAVTATLPAVASNFHYITFIEILKYFTVANAASATPLVVTTTNLPGSLAFSFGQPAGAIGVTEERVYVLESPVKSSVVNTATTIVCPATTGIIWRVNIFYYLST